MNNPVGWFEIYLNDMPRAKAFYESAFEQKLEKLNSPEVELWAFPMARDKPGAAGALVKMPNFPSGRNSVLVYFSCDDCAVQEGRVKKFGGRVEKPKTSIGEYGFILIVYAPKATCSGCIR
jgi:uncharacterized protein